MKSKQIQPSNPRNPSNLRLRDVVDPFLDRLEKIGVFTEEPAGPRPADDGEEASD